jgi:hypothetical protein
MMSDQVNQMVTLTVITISSAYCICMYYSDHSFDHNKWGLLYGIWMYYSDPSVDHLRVAKVNQMITLAVITISGAYCRCTYILSIRSFDHFRVAKVNQMVTLTVITISGAYCTVYGCII